MTPTERRDARPLAEAADWLEPFRDTWEDEGPRLDLPKAGEVPETKEPPE